MNTLESNTQKKEFRKNGNPGDSTHEKERSIIVDPQASDYLNERVVNKRYLNILNYSMLPDHLKKDHLTLGVTSPNKGEGKTITAANLAVSFAAGRKMKTVLVDLNIGNPGLHEIFGTKISPGLQDSIRNGGACISRTRVEHLYVMPAGEKGGFSAGLAGLRPMQEIIYCLKKEFEVIILDLCAVLPFDDFPIGCMESIDEIIMVIDGQKTKYAAVEETFRYIRKDQTCGFVFNYAGKA